MSAPAPISQSVGASISIGVGLARIALSAPPSVPASPPTMISTGSAAAVAVMLALLVLVTLITRGVGSVALGSV